MAIIKPEKGNGGGRKPSQNQDLPPHPRCHDVAEETVIIGNIAPGSQTARNGGLEELHLTGKGTDDGVEFVLAKFVRDSSWDEKRYSAYMKGSHVRMDRKCAENLIVKLEELLKEADELEGNG